MTKIANTDIILIAPNRKSVRRTEGKKERRKEGECKNGEERIRNNTYPQFQCFISWSTKLK